MAVTDNFTRADSSGLGVNWTQNSSGAIGIKSNAAAWNSGATGFCQSTWTAGVGSNDQYSQAAALTLSGSKDMGVVVRGGGSSDANVTGYLFVINDADANIGLGSSMSCGIYRINGTSSVTLVGSTQFTATISANDVLRLEVSGTTLTAKINGTTKATGTDSNVASGLPGIYIGGSGSTSSLGSFQADVLSGGTSFSPGGGALTLTGNTPSLAGSTTRSPTSGALVLTGTTPSLIQGTVRSPTIGTLTLTGGSPTVAQNFTVASATAMTLTGNTPTVSAGGNVTVSPTGGTLTLTGTTPTLSTTANVTVSPTGGALTLTGTTPTLSANGNTSFSPGGGSLGLTGATPMADLGLPTTTGTLTLSGTTATLDRGLAPGTGALTLTGGTPSLGGSVTLSPGGASLTLTGNRPQVHNSGFTGANPAWLYRYRYGYPS